MLNLGHLQASLGIDSSGLHSAESQLRAFGASANSTFDRAGSAASSCASQMGQILGVTLSIVGAYSAANKAVSSWFSLISGGISIVDDYQKKIIGTSYILTTMSDVKPPDLSRAYGEWKDYFGWLYQQALDADKKSAASAQEIFGVSVELAKKGVVAASQEEMDTIGRLTDLMKAVTPTYASLEQQARGEIEAMLSGTTRLGAQTALILAQIDPLFKQNIASAREQGTVLEYVRSVLPQLDQYTKDLMGTWDAVGASLKSAWSIINIKAFGDAHREVVGLAAQLGNRLVDNGQLTADGERAALALGQAWVSAKDSISGALDYVLNNSDKVISDIGAIASTIGSVTGFAVDAAKGFLGLIDSARQAGMDIQVAMVQARAAVGYVIEWFEILGRTAKDVAHGIVWDFGEIGPAIDRAYASMADSSGRWANIAVQDANAVRGAVLGAMVAGKTPAGFSFMEGQTAAGPVPSASLGSSSAPPTPPIRPFTGKTAGGAGGGGGADSALKEMEQLNKEVEKARKDAMAAESDAFMMVYKLKKDTAAFYAKGEQAQLEAISLTKGYYDTMAGITLNLKEQVKWKEKSLELEKIIGKASLQKFLKGEGKNLTPDVKYDLVRLQALTNQTKQYQLEWSKVETTGKMVGQTFSLIGESLLNSSAAVMQGTVSISSAVTDLLQSTSNASLSMLTGMVGQWLEAKIMIMSLDFAASMGLITNAAAVAGAKAYAAHAEIPFVGLAIGAGVAAAAMGAIMLLGNTLKSSAGGDYQVAATGPRLVHQEETILPAWAAQGWRDIVSRESSGRGRPGENGSGGTVIHYAPVINAIDARGVDAILEKHSRALTKVINREVGRRGRKL